MSEVGGGDVNLQVDWVCPSVRGGEGDVNLQVDWVCPSV